MTFQSVEPSAPAKPSAFTKPSAPVSLAALLDLITAYQPVVNRDALDLTAKISGVAELDKAGVTDLCFVTSDKYLAALTHTQAGVVLVSPKLMAQVPKSAQAVVVASPYLAYASISALFEYTRHAAGVHPTANIHQTATLGENVSVGAYVVIGAHSVIGDGVVIGAHSVIGDGVEIGEDVWLDSHVALHHHCIIGARTRIHSHASIGAEGFGFAPTANRAQTGWVRIAQLGRVLIGQDVRIGAGTCIDRGAMGDTVIGDFVIIDNLVQIAHNVHIGAGTAIAANTGIAGSSKIGKNCIIGGAVGIAGHLHICDDVTITAMSMVIKSITTAGSYSSGTTAMPSHHWRRAAVKFRQSGER